MEILSPSSVGKDMLKKRRIYAKGGVPEYWIVAPEERWVTVLTLKGEAYEETEPVSGDQPIPTRVLEGLPVRAGEIFPEAEPAEV